jgi:hypothetical protein
MTTSTMTVEVHYKSRHEKNTDEDLYEPNTMELREALDHITDHANQHNLRIVSVIVLPSEAGTMISKERAIYDELGHESGRAMSMAYQRHPEAVTISVIFQSLE